MPGPTALFSIITPSRGLRPRALAQAIESAAVSLDHARETLSVLRPDLPKPLELLLGYDGLPKGSAVLPEPLPDFVRVFYLPPDRDFGNAPRNALLKAAKGLRVLFLDDDNALTPEALLVHARHLDAEMVVARIDTTRAFDIPFLPRAHTGDLAEIVRPGNIDPLCISLSRDLALTRCAGWSSQGGYEADYVNILRYARRAKSVAFVEDIVGVYDAGAGMDAEGRNRRQKGRGGDAIAKK